MMSDLIIYPTEQQYNSIQSRIQMLMLQMVALSKHLDNINKNYDGEIYKEDWDFWENRFHQTKEEYEKLRELIGMLYN